MFAERFKVCEGNRALKFKNGRRVVALHHINGHVYSDYLVLRAFGVRSL